MIDIDHLKRINDTYGHLIGGEEFVVVMRCEQAGDTAIAFERLRSHTQAHAFQQAGQVTVSVRFTQLRSGDTPNLAFERADLAVYFGKQKGSNQMHEHAALVAAGHLQDSTRDSAVELF